MLPDSDSHVLCASIPLPSRCIVNWKRLRLRPPPPAPSGALPDLSEGPKSEGGTSSMSATSTSIRMEEVQARIVRSWRSIDEADLANPNTDDFLSASLLSTISFSRISSGSSPQNRRPLHATSKSEEIAPETTLWLFVLSGSHAAIDDPFAGVDLDGLQGVCSILSSVPEMPKAH
jgi:hypothetical protein